MSSLERRLIEHLILVEDYAVSNVEYSLVKHRTERVYLTPKTHEFAHELIKDFNAGFRSGRVGRQTGSPSKSSAWKRGYRSGEEERMKDSETSAP